jgi:hypothetical protein
VATLAANALITLDEFRDAIGIDASEAINEAKALLAINAASQEIEDYCCRKFIAPSSAIEEIFDGDRSKEYYVRHLRITETPTLYTLESDYTWDTLATTYEWGYDGDTGLIYLRDFVFWAGTRNWKVAYKYGWPRADVPDPVKRVAVQLTQRLIRLAEGREGEDSLSFGNTATTYNLAGHWTDGMKTAIQPYRRIAVG